MNVLPHNLWSHYKSQFSSKYEFATFLAQITLQSDFLQTIKSDAPVLTTEMQPKRKKRALDENNVEIPENEPELPKMDNYYGRGIFYQKFVGQEIYKQCSNALNIDLITNPDLALQFEYLIPIAIWYWRYVHMSRFMGDFEAINDFLEVKSFAAHKSQQMYVIYVNLMR